MVVTQRKNFHRNHPPKLIDVYVTFANAGETERIVSVVIKEHLAACANYWPIRSQFHWKGKIVRDREIAVLFKTTTDRYAALERRIKKLHSYTVPCIIAWAVTRSHPAYQRWVIASTDGPA